MSATEYKQVERFGLFKRDLTSRNKYKHLMVNCRLNVFETRCTDLVENNHYKIKDKVSCELS